MRVNIIGMTSHFQQTLKICERIYLRTHSSILSRFYINISTVFSLNLSYEPLVSGTPCGFLTTNYKLGLNQMLTVSESNIYICYYKESSLSLIYKWILLHLQRQICFDFVNHFHPLTLNDIKLTIFVANKADSPRKIIVLECWSVSIRYWLSRPHAVRIVELIAQ